MRRRAGVAAAVLAGVLALALPALSAAAFVAVGSLSTAGPASISYPEPVDTAFWASAGPGGTSLRVPRRGQVRVIHLEGCTQPAPGGGAPLTQFHFQTLMPRPGGAVKVRITSQALDMPVCGQNATTQTVTTFHPKYLCARSGDYVAFNVEGGGAAYTVFAPSTGAVTDAFTAANKTNNGDTLRGSPHADVQLLMTYVLGTRHDARPFCLGK